jgi:putative endonuclease
MSRSFYVYIMARRSGTLYIGVTNDIARRVHEHKHGLVTGFTIKYRVSRLVYCEHTDDVGLRLIARSNSSDGRGKRRLPWWRV